MAHIHSNEYQIRIVYENGTEELCEWIDGQERLAQAMAAAHRAHVKAYWLRERNSPCPDCLNREQQIVVECPITNVPTARYRPHDSVYLAAVGARNRDELI